MCLGENTPSEKRHQVTLYFRLCFGNILLVPFCPGHNFLSCLSPFSLPYLVWSFICYCGCCFKWGERGWPGPWLGRPGGPGRQKKEPAIKVDFMRSYLMPLNVHLVGLHGVEQWGVEGSLLRAQVGLCVEHVHVVVQISLLVKHLLLFFVTA